MNHGKDNSWFQSSKLCRTETDSLSNSLILDETSPETGMVYNDQTHLKIDITKFCPRNFCKLERFPGQRKWNFSL